MKINANDLVRMFQQAWNEQWGYIWGTSGQVWTQSSQNRATREMTVKYGKKWLGRKVADCSGLFVWAFRQQGAEIYHGSNTIWNKYLTDVRGEVSSGVALRPGTAVFLRRADGNRHHIGLYIGDGKCIEAKSTRDGVVMSDIGHWDEYGELKDVDYDNMQPERVEAERITLRKGSKGENVVHLQNMLNEQGYRLVVDGIFGTSMQAAVRAFQTAHGLSPDGIVGPKTWSVLEGEQDDMPAEADTWDELSVEAKLHDLNERVKRMEESLPA